MASLTLIFVCQLAGELLVGALGLPVPGPVVGMAILFAGLCARGRVGDELGRVADTLLANLSLLFVPAGVGVVQNLDLLAQRGVAIALVLAASVVVTLLVTAGTFLVINRLLARRRQSS